MHESRLSTELRALLARRRTAALGTLDGEGEPFVSLAPLAPAPALAAWVVFVSALAAHTRHLRAHPRVSLLVADGEVDGAPVHALSRLTVQAEAVPLEPGDEAWDAARTAYLARFAEAQALTELGDFRFVLLRPVSGRQIAGFGAARDVTADELRALLAEAG